MKIYSINSINYRAKKVVKPSELLNNTKSSERYKEDFYNNIRQYLDKKYDKGTYIKNFSEDMTNYFDNSKKGKYSPLEQKYINDLITTLDLTENVNKISDVYLADKMKKLLEHVGK